MQIVVTKSCMNADQLCKAKMGESKVLEKNYDLQQ